MIYPNPANNYLRIESGNYEKINIRLFTVSGQFLIEKKIIGNGVILTDEFAEGVPILEITAGLTIQHYKIMVTH